MPALPLISILTAPTAAGKTALSLRLAHEFELDIVAADAFTVYRGLDIGTAKPTPQERGAVPHHLLDVVDVTEDYDVAGYAAEAEAALREILAAGGRPLIVGGTGFYLSALVRGLPLTPPSDPARRAELEAELTGRGLDALLAEIERANPEEAARMERNPRRVVRALEVYRATGLFPHQFGYSAPAFRYQVTAFSPDPADLEANIVQRTHEMLAGGWPAEAAWLAEQVSPERNPRPTAWQALGYAEALAVARGTLSPEDAAQSIALATRQYTKRQLTWLRRQLGAEILNPAAAEARLRTLLAHPASL